MPGIQIKDKMDERSTFKVARFRKDIRTTVAHKHKNYIEIIFLNTGTGTHQIDDLEFEVIPSTLFVIRKEQVHCWNLTNEPDGYVLILRNSLLVDGLDHEMSLLFKSVSAINCSYLHDTSAIQTLFELMMDAVDSKDQNNSAYLHGLLKSLLAKIVMVSSVNEQPQLFNHHLFGRFNELASAENELHNNVSYYAKKLNCTPQNLNAICRKELNLSASEFISKRIVSEVKRLLTYSNLSISEIGNHLHFKDASHFSKFFKKQTGIAPKDYRIGVKSDK